MQKEIHLTQYIFCMHAGENENQMRYP